MKLVIVESPTKARTIGRFLGDGFVIKASMGHVMDLPKSKLGVDVENNFLPQYEISEGKKATIDELKKLAKDATEIVLATDPDREGEAISAHIQTLLEGDGKKNKDKKFVRIVFHEITKEAIDEALLHPGEVNTALVDAQTARRVLDRLVGYKISPVLWQKVRRGLSAGRVQSVALRLIVEREGEIEKFNKLPYWTISVILTNDIGVSGKREAGSKKNSKSAEGTQFDLIEINGGKIEEKETFRLYDGEYSTTKTTIDTQEKADAIVSELKKRAFIIEDVQQKQSKRSSQPPFTTSTLQQEAARRFAYSGKRTMSLAQKLYEEGYITYHRTDSVNLAMSAIGSMRNYIEKEFGAKYIPEKPKFYSNKQKLAQEAHEAIRPTKVQDTSDKIQMDLGKDYAKLYDLIWRRAVACQMSDALVESTTVFAVTTNSSQFTVDSSQQKENTANREPITNNQYRFKTTGSVLAFDGFLKVNPYGLQDRKLPQFEALQPVDLIEVLPESHETPPPPRYNDASLIGSLEEAGIGRPSTYASIISTIEARQYIERNSGRFIPTPVGTAVTDFLVKNFSTIDDIPFTAQMEDELDRVANGEKKWEPVIKEFYTPFEAALKEVGKAARVEIPTEETGEKCPKDGAPLVIRVGKFGKFISCKNFPTCDFKKPYLEETDFMCPKCGGLSSEVSAKGGKVIAKKTRKGRTFYGCSNYPNCDFAVWKLQDIKNGNWKKPASPKRQRGEPKKDYKKETVAKKTSKKTTE